MGAQEGLWARVWRRGGESQGIAGAVACAYAYGDGYGCGYGDGYAGGVAGGGADHEEHDLPVGGELKGEPVPAKSDGVPQGPPLVIEPAGAGHR